MCEEDEGSYECQVQMAKCQVELISVTFFLLLIEFSITCRWVIPFDLKIAHLRRHFLSIWPMVCFSENSLVSQILLATGDLFDTHVVKLYSFVHLPSIHLMHLFSLVLSWWMKRTRGHFLRTYYSVWLR